MKYLFGIVLTVLQLAVIAQPQTGSVDAQIFRTISSSMHQKSKKIIENVAVVTINGNRYISTVVKVNSSFSESQLPDGVVFGSQIGNIATLKIPIENVSVISELVNIEYLEIAPKITPNITNAVLDLRADSVHDGLGLNQSYTGKNVIIGVTDWGFDYSHPMFYDTALNHTRIIAAWDQFKTSGPAPSGLSYGTEYVGETELLAAQSDTACTYYDYATHGSHVAGIAGGGGAGIGLKGVAYDANFLFTAIQLDMGSVIDAVSWMKTTADDEGKRLVVNMSWLLYYMGPLDGTSLGSQALDNFTNNGVIIVTSGGNNGNVDYHIKKDFSQDSVVTRINFYPYSAHPSMWGQSISMWGEENHSFGSKIEVYQNGLLLVSSSTYLTSTAPGYVDSFLISGMDTVFYNLATDSAHPQNMKPHMRLRVKNTNTNLLIVLKSYANDGIVHYYNVTELSNGAGNWGMPFTSFGTTGTNGDSHYGIGCPACGKGVISVAAHASELRIPGGGVIEGNLANFSREGPTTDERVKPDISAPGVNVASSISSYTTRSYNTFTSTSFNGRTYDFAKFSGTSMSGPATAGVVALMLEANPTLTAAEVKQVLKTTARKDSKTGVIPVTGSVEWGWGKVNALEAVREASRLVSISEAPIFSNVRVYPTLATTVLNIEGVNQENYSYIIFNINGAMVLQGTTERVISVSNLPKGTYILHLESKSENGVKKIIKM